MPLAPKDSRYFSGQGKLYLSEIHATTGAPINGFLWLGNAPDVEATTSQNKVKHNESYTGQNLTDLIIERQTEMMLTATLESFDKNNLLTFLFGSTSVISGATVSAESNTVYTGRSFPLVKQNLTSFTSLTSDPAGTTYVNGTQYSVDLKTGMVTNLTIANATAVLANYVAGDMEKITAFTASNKHYWLKFAGYNTAEGNTPVIVDFFKVRPTLLKTLSFINDNITPIPVEFEVVYQSTYSSDGGFSRILQTVQA